MLFLYIFSSWISLKYLWCTHETGDTGYLWKVGMLGKRGLPFCTVWDIYICTHTYILIRDIHIHHLFKAKTISEDIILLLSLTSRLSCLTFMQFSFPTIKTWKVEIWWFTKPLTTSIPNSDQNGATSAGEWWEGSQKVFLTLHTRTPFWF